ncbi:MAG: protein translocase subunit SecF [Bacteroidota bacterium]
MQFFKDPKVNFLSKRKMFAFASAVYIVIGLLATFILGPKLGIDFQGGTEIAVEFSQSVNTNDIRNAVEQTGMTGSEIKSFGGDNQHLIRVKESEKSAEAVQEALEKAFPNQNIEVLKIDKIGPKIGSELFFDAILAVILAVLGILIYIAFRFEFAFGLGAIIALVHDVIVAFTVIVIVHHTGLINLEINQAILAAMLTVVGYSINDTVIIFDRIRENRERQKGMNFIKMINLSINEVLNRTINTSLTTSLVLITLIFFGGAVLQGFAFTMLIGIITGTYSSWYIASSFVVWYLGKYKKIDLEKGYAPKSAVGVKP